MPFNFDSRHLVIPHHVNFEDLVAWFPRPPAVRILIVADTAVSFTSSFGVGKVIDLIRANADGYVSLVVDLASLGTIGSAIAVNAAPGARGAKYTNFRFASEVAGAKVINGYDQIWCFGFAPGNDGSADDKNIWASPYASTDGDLTVLTAWMNAGGGILAMGDHHYLGAAMCARIPRVRSMRRWTNAQAVPPIGGPERHDTNRPQTDLQDPDFNPSPDVIPDAAQSDAIAQMIDWKRYDVWTALAFKRRQRPHPLLCGGALGVIDVLPDHPHEGHIFEDYEVSITQNYTIGGVTGVEYPACGAIQPRPEVIAWANTLPDPPFNFDKGDTPAKRFGVIGVYDGDAVDCGRVVVDSTWHHWMDMNIEGLESAVPDTDYQKVVRYFRNCAVWLARESQRREMLAYASLWTVSHAVFYESFNGRGPLHLIGAQAIDAIGRLTSDCLVSEWVDLFLEPALREAFITEKWPDPDPCWSRPPAGLARQMAIGGIVNELVAVRDALHAAGDHPDRKPGLAPEAIGAAMATGARRGLEAFAKAVSANADALARYSKLSVFRDAGAIQSEE